MAEKKFLLRSTKKNLFCEGALRQPGGSPFLATRPWKYTEVVKEINPGDAAEEADQTKASKRSSRKAIMAELAAAGVKFRPTMTTEELQELLDGFKATSAPASSSADSKEETLSGVGNQDVI